MNKIILSFFVLVFATGVLAEDWRYQVKQGDTLWDLAERIAIDATYAEKILEYNKIPDAHYLQPGTYIHIPLEWLVNLPSEVKIVSLQGSVHAILKGKKTSPRLGDVLTQGGELITGADSTALLEFSDGSTLIIRPNSHLKLNSIAQSHDGEILQTRIHIERGRINLNANPKSNPSHRMEIETPSAVSAVRGTQFRVNVDPLTKTSTTAVLEGKVAVDSQSVSREINQGFGVVTKTNEAPSPAIKLLDPPALPTTQLSTNRPAINLAWNSLSDATSYRVQVSSDVEFTDTIYDAVTNDTQVSNLYFAKDGLHYARVRGIDENELGGRDALAKISVNARPEPPLVIQPKTGTQTANGDVNFKWLQPLDSEQIHFQLASDKNFSNILIDDKSPLSDHYQTIETLSSGNYYWRVAAIESNNKSGPFSHPLSLSIIDKPNPELNLNPDSDDISFSWTPIPNYERVRIQVAQDPEFKNIVSDEWVTSSDYSIKDTRSGNYYVRLGVDDPMSEDTIFGESQHINIPFKDWLELLATALGALLIL